MCGDGVGFARLVNRTWNRRAWLPGESEALSPNGMLVVNSVATLTLVNVQTDVVKTQTMYS